MQIIFFAKWLDFLYQFDFAPSDTAVFFAKFRHNQLIY